MHLSFFLLAPASLAAAAVLRRGDPTFQEIPTTAKPDNTFSNGKPSLSTEPPTVDAVPSEIYGARSIDLPFGRLYHGDMKFFSAGQLNSKSGITDQWMDKPGTIDSADQSACGIPDNAFSISKVAIHPYFLKYADLSRKSSTSIGKDTRTALTRVHRLLYAGCLHQLLERQGTISWAIRHDPEGHRRL